jgi:hypothetical protein
MKMQPTLPVLQGAPRQLSAPLEFARKGYQREIRMTNKWLLSVCCVLLLATLRANAATVSYTLDNVILDNGQAMTGTFLWTYAAGDFENGNGQFVELGIPGTSHSLDVLTVTFDIGKSIEITLDLNLHDDGIDIMLVFSPALSTTQAVTLDLVNSKYAIGGNGFNEGLFLSGRIAPVIAPTPMPAAWWRFATAPYQQP